MKKKLRASQAKTLEELKRSEKRARKLIDNGCRKVARTIDGSVVFNSEYFYDLMHAVVTDVLEGRQSRANLAKYLPKAAKAAARVIRKKGS